MMTWDLYRVFVAAVVSRALVLALGLASDWAVADYDTSARWDVPNTSAACVMSDGDEKVVQARRRRARGAAAGSRRSHACRACRKTRWPGRSAAWWRRVNGAGLRRCSCSAHAARHHRAPPPQDGLAWDSLHFLRIAQCGYETEKSFAFFPLLPGTMRGVQSTRACPWRSAQPGAAACHPALCADVARAVLNSLMPALYPRCTLALAGFVVSNCAFVFAALVLYWLGCLTLRDGDMARRAAYFFCFNPASVFYSAVYSESLFAFLTFSGALSLALNRPNRAAIAFFASAAARSNGAQRASLIFCRLRCAARARFGR